VRFMLHFFHFSFGEWRFVFSRIRCTLLYESYGMRISDAFGSLSWLATSIFVKNLKNLKPNFIKNLCLFQPWSQHTYGSREGTCREKLSRAHEMLSLGNEMLSRSHEIASRSHEMLSCAHEIKKFLHVPSLRWPVSAINFFDLVSVFILK